MPNLTLSQQRIKEKPFFSMYGVLSLFPLHRCSQSLALISLCLHFTCILLLFTNTKASFLYIGTIVCLEGSKMFYQHQEDFLFLEGSGMFHTHQEDSLFLKGSEMFPSYRRSRISVVVENISVRIDSNNCRVKASIAKVVELLPQETNIDLGLRCWFTFRVNNWEHLIQIPCPQDLILLQTVP
jgi:hypothetical protein